MSNEETREGRIFTSGYMLGRRHGYDDAVEESYPELHTPEGVARAVGDAITDYLNPHQTRPDPADDFRS